MVEYGRRHLKKEGVILSMFMAELIWNTILAMIEGDEL